MSLVLRSTLLAALLAACGGTSDGVAIPSPSPGAASSPDPNQAGDDAASASPSGSVDGGLAVDPAVDRRIDPIEVGRAWTYDVTVLGFYPTCSNGVFTATTLEAVPREGKTALRVQSLCKDSGVYEYAVEGDRVWSWQAGQWRLSLDAPVKEGHGWSDGFRDYYWVSRGKVTTAAGTFDECWEARVDAGFDSYTVFCRGVGPVKWHYEDGFGNGYEAVLLSKNF